MKTPLKNKPITDSHALLQSIERKDALFRFASTIFFVMLFAIIALLAYRDNNLQHQNNQLLKAQTSELAQQKQTIDKLQANDKHTAASFADLQGHIDCIVNLFTQPNRANLTITDISTCQLTPINTSSGSAGSSTKSGTVSNTPPKTQTSTTTQPSRQSSSSDSGNSTPQPNPTSHPLLCTVTFGLIGCK